jgi:hypothetical protein
MLLDVKNSVSIGQNIRIVRDMASSRLQQKTSEAEGCVAGVPGRLTVTGEGISTLLSARAAFRRCCRGFEPGIIVAPGIVNP